MNAMKAKLNVRKLRSDGNYVERGSLRDQRIRKGLSRSEGAFL